MSLPPPHVDRSKRTERESCGFDPRRLQRLSERLLADVASGAIPGAVVHVMRGGHVALNEAFGHADGAAQRAMQLDSVFRIASMTKPLTAVAALILMERGTLQLIDPVAEYLPALRNVTVGIEATDPDTGQRELSRVACRRAMTVHDLLRHTAGFTYGQLGDSLVQRSYRNAKLSDPQQTNAEMITKLADVPLAHQPGTTFEYGMSTDVLGRVVEVVSGMSLDQFFVQNITRPLSMPDTAFDLSPDQRQRLAEPVRPAVETAVPAVTPYHPMQPAKWFSGGGGLLSTATDYARFAQMLLNLGELDGVRILSRKTIALMLDNHLPDTLDYGPHTVGLGIAAPLRQLGQGYGLGIGVRVRSGLSPVPGSKGDAYWGGALGPYFWIDPAEHLSVVFMVQELNIHVRMHYRSMLRGMVYQALA